MEVLEETGHTFQYIDVVVLSTPGSSTSPKVFGVPAVVVNQSLGFYLAFFVL